MIKRTLYFGNPAYLSVKNKQLTIRIPDQENPRTVPIEDIGVVVADHPQITMTQTVVTALQENNAVIIWCSANHMPISMCLPIQANDTLSEKVRYQLEASEPLKKQLWRQTVIAKIQNQAKLLRHLGHKTLHIDKMIPRVNSGDPENYEGQAAAIYWQVLLDSYEVTRGRYDGGPNVLFNYGYAILRAVIARSLTGSGCLPVLGIHHSNKYNPYCLADDIMEPYRPIIDKYIVEYLSDKETYEGELTKEDKAYLLNIPVLDISIQGKSSPLMVGAQRTTASLVKCYQGTARKILYPDLIC
ncbi:MAG: type II CRISPR-associated endonuclease Cas1 [Chitinophagales bacterium]|nr:type II CRISPR-associated endonuclease Cas1 [Chitinophagales bacterium]